MSRVELVVIDPQIDFCDPKGALSVPGADGDMKRLAKMVRKMGKGLANIHTTLDSHHSLHIASPCMWLDQNGKHPAPFTNITAEQVRQGVWRPRILSWLKKFQDYVDTLERNGRYTLTIWNPHCLIGSAGYAVYPELFAAYTEWECEAFRFVNYVTKGSAVFTEHYSAIQADVPDANDPTTQINTGFLQTMMEADTILAAGEALTHCIANTFRDAANYFHDGSFAKKLVLLEDATSGIPGCEQMATDFLNEMKTKGMRIARTTDF